MHQVETTIPMGRRSAPASPANRIRALAAWLAPAALAVIGGALLAGGAGATDRCVVADNGAGTAALPANCATGHRSPGDVLFILDGLAAGDRILGKIRLHSIVLTSESPGGSLGGTHQIWTAKVDVEMTGVGGLATYHRVVTLPVSIAESDAAPRTPGAPVQSFDTDLFRLFGALPPGDPDFDLLRIFAGSDFAMPGPGHTTLTLTPDGNWAVDSFFDITYRIDFVGAPGGPFAGRSGSTTAGCNAQAGAPHPTGCAAPDNGSGTADFPPSCGDGYRSPPQQAVSLNGLPPGAPITGTIRLTSLLTATESPGGDLGGHQQTFGGIAVLDLKGNGDLYGFNRTVSLHLTGTSQSGPRGGGAMVQGFPAEITALQGQIPPGDPDFDLLRITAGTSLGLPAPGHTTLTRQPGGDWAVDSFFDIEYRIDFVGAPGSMLAGYSGTDFAQARFEEGAAEAKPRCEVPDNGSGTAAFPVPCADGYSGPPEALVALNGLPPGEPVLGAIKLIGLSTSLETPGGTLGGTTQQFDCRIEVDMHGMGSLAGFSRQFSIPATGSSQCGPRGGGATPQNFPNELLTLQGVVVGDPDFDLLRITAGSGFGMPSPGHTTLTLTPGGNWAVDSFFDIEYRIDFVGAPGGPLAGMSGSTQAENRFRAGDLKVTAVGDRAPTALRVGRAAPNPTSSGARVALELPVAARVHAAVFDVNGRRVATIEGGELAAGRHELHWDGRDAAGREARAGLYFMSVEAAGRRAERRIVIAR